MPRRGERVLRWGSPEDDEGPSVDPLADLLFTLIAAVLPAIFVLAPLLRAPSLGEAREARAGAASPRQVEITAGGRSAALIVAGREGLRLSGPPARVVGPDAVPSDPGLAATLDDLRSAAKPVVVLIEPDGLESAFLLEPVLAAHGPATVLQVRAELPCSDAVALGSPSLCRAARGP